MGALASLHHEVWSVVGLSAHLSPSIYNHSCVACVLHEDANTVCVEGVGPTKRGTLMVVGEAPGRNEDQQGAPFVGAAGRVLNHALKLAGLQRDEVFITNIVKCRPLENRKPTPEEADTCGELYLLREVKRVVPRAILAVGALAYETLFPEEAHTISSARGIAAPCLRMSYLTVVPTWHPAYVLYQGGPSSDVGKQFRDDVKVWAAYGA